MTSTELDSCAVGGFFAEYQSNSGLKNISMVLEFLAKLPHRGGQIFTNHNGEVVKVGDGAGVSCSIDQKYYDNFIRAQKPQNGIYGIGNFFLPLEEEAREISRQKIKEICEKFDVRILNNNQNEEWRKIHFNSDDSDSAKDLKLQKFEQIFLAPNQEISADKFEKILMQVHQEIEEFSHQLNQEYKSQNQALPKLAVASLSCQKVIYKGMLLPHEVAYFDDLQKSNPKEVVYHIRQSTNVSPSPGNAQPFNIIAHNGELNSVDGNADKNHKAARGFSDSRTFDEHLRELTLQGKDIIEAVTTLMPPPLTNDRKIDAMLEEMKSQGFEYNGPAHMVFSSGNIQGAKLDSSALRPSRYVIAQNQSGKNCLYIGSEDMFSADRLNEMGLTLVERGMLKAGEMITIENGVVKKNDQILSELADRFKTSGRRIEKIEANPAGLPKQRLDLGQRELEVRKYHLLPLCEGATKKIAMGDDTNPLKTDEKDLPTLAEHFKQKFSQVSSPPLDSDKESASFSLDTYLGKKTLSYAPIEFDINKNLSAAQIDQTLDSTINRTVYKIDSPILKVGELEDIKTKAQDFSATIDLSFDLTSLSEEDRNNEEKVLAQLRQKVKEICFDVEKKVRAGKSIIILDGSQTSPEKMILPDVLVTAAVHSHLHKVGLEKQASLIVNSSEMVSAHHFSVLSALGAAAVNPAGGYDFAAEIANGNQGKYQQYCDNFQHAVEKAHLVTMAKYGISSAEVYRGSRLVETLTIDLEEKSEEYDPSCLGEAFKSVKSCAGFNGKFGVDEILTTAVTDHQRKYSNQIITSGHFAYSPSGVTHTYNPVIVGAIRGVTTTYRTKRALVEEYFKLAQKLEEKNKEIPRDFYLELDVQLKESLANKNRKITQLENQNDKLINSLFFIDGIARELENTAAKQKKSSADIEDLAGGQQPKFSLNETQIKQFLSVATKTGNSLSNAFSQYKKEEINSTQLKQIFLNAAGYDANQIEVIEEWTKLVKAEKVFEAAEVFKSLNQKNQDRINHVFAEQKANQDKISALKAELAETQIDKTVNNILLEATQKQDFAHEIGLKIQELRQKAQENNLLPEIANDVFDLEQINAHKIDEPFAQAMAEISQNKKDFRVTIADHLEIKTSLKASDRQEFMKLDEINLSFENSKDLQSVSDILANHFVTGGMSHGALTLPAHNDVAKAAQLVGSKSCTGEGGKPAGQKAKIVQIASGRFGITPEYFSDADTVEIKIVQGAKPGEGGMLPAGKVSVEIAAVRGATPSNGLISPPPHHDIYSIEDLQELIHDLKELKPGINVAVKLCASEGIDQIAIGVAKSGADIINIASGSGGTGAAAIDSIKSTGLPSEVGLVMVHQALSKAGIRPLVKLQTSGFPNTPEGVIIMSILGGDILESGTTDVMLLGCDMHRKCNVPGACGPGITNNAEGYQGHAEDLALYKLNMAKAVQEELLELGVNHLSELHGRVDLLNAENLRGKVSDQFIESLLASSDYEQLPEEKLRQYRRNANEGTNQAQYEKLNGIDLSQRSSVDVGEVDVVNRTFGATFAYQNYQELADKEADHLTIKTNGTAGQSHGAFNVHGLCLEHTGSVQDGFGKSMNGGVLVVKQPESETHLTESIYAGNAALYGASSGKAFIPSAGSRCAVLMKGATLVVSGNVGDYGCEYMTSGSFLALGKVGKHFGAGMSGGISVLYNQKNYLAQKEISNDIRYANKQESETYFEAIKNLLEEDLARTQSPKAASILKNFEKEKSNFKIVIPKTLDKIQTLEELQKVEQSFSLRASKEISVFEQVWLESRKLELSQTKEALKTSDYELIELQSKASAIALEQQTKMRQYGSVGARIVGGLGVPDQVLSDDVNELMSELFSHGKKCSCDSVTCTSSEQRREKPKSKHPSSGCPLAKNPNLINGILNDQSLSEENRAKEAFKMQIQQSPFAGFTGSACPAPCQDSCTHSADDEGNSEAVKIKRIELLLHRIAVKKGWYEELHVFQPEIANDNRREKVMIVGSGPSALEAAYHLAKKGVAVEIFEKDDKIGGLLRYGIPDHKLQKETIDFYAAELKKMGVKFHLNRPIEMKQIKATHPNFNFYLDARGVVQTPVLFDQNFAKTNVLEGGNHSLAMDFLTYCNKFHEAQKQENLAGVQNNLTHPFEEFKLGKEIAVLGNGDTAEDVKRTILKLNSQLNESEKVKLITINRQPQESERAKLGSNYPRGREVGSLDLSIETNHEENISQVRHFDNTAPKSFATDEQGKIKGIHVDSTYVIESDFSRNNRGKAQKIGEEFIECSSVITALGFRAPELHEETIKNFGQLKNGSIITIGDVATKSGRITNGSELIVNSQASGLEVAKRILDRTPSASPEYFSKLSTSKLENLTAIGATMK